MKESLLAAAVLLALATPVGTQRLSPEADLKTRVERTLGSTPADCGGFYITQRDRPAPSAPELRKAVACITEHAAKRTPAWMFVWKPGIDSCGAQGLLATRDGKVRYFGYDSNPGGSATPHFHTAICVLPGVKDDDKEGPTITCEAV